MNEYLKVVWSEFVSFFKKVFWHWQVLVIALVFGIFFAIMGQQSNVGERWGMSILMTFVVILGLLQVIDNPLKYGFWSRLWWADICFVAPVSIIITRGYSLGSLWLWFPATAGVVLILLATCIQYRKTVWKVLKRWETVLILVYFVGCVVLLMQNPQFDTSHIGDCIFLAFLLALIFGFFGIGGGEYGECAWVRATFINIGVVLTISFVIGLALTEKPSWLVLLPAIVVQILIFICMYVQHVRKEVQKRRDAAINQEL